MALPSSRRPVEVEEELREEGEKFKKDLLKIKVNLNSVFMDTMADCNLKMRYGKLPQTWLKQLHEDFEVDFIWEHPAEKAKQRAIRRLRKAAILGKLTIGEMKRKIEDLKSGVLKPGAVEPNVSEIDEKTPGPSSSDLFQNEFNAKIVDLTKEPPPDYWVAAYIKGNHLPRVMKVFTDHDKGQRIIYYDYNIEDIKVSFGDTQPGSFLVHESNNFLSWRK
ncbi:unnamed protein product [Allacma fusca]|uniref:Uncharacterized protein n=1 Tax=Allacma fusca TaxID=39272 RepID=A0A8J2JF26_9HEXA|nr:unnamed protein product [Allacma fusca]